MDKSKATQTTSPRSKRSEGKPSSRHLWIYRLVAILLALALLAGLALYYILDRPAGRLQQTAYVFVRPGQDLETVIHSVQSRVWLRYPRLFTFLARREGLEAKLRPGRYAITPRMNMGEIIRALAEGEESPVTISVGALRTTEEISRHLSSHLMLPERELYQLLSDSTFCARYGLSTHSIRSLLLRGDYEVLWSISAEGLIDTIARHHRRFWNVERRAQAERLGLRPDEVTSLAAIVEEESAKRDEYPRIAGLYLNRLRRGMLLQSDPTVKFALEDFALRRILYAHLSVASPYNTYRVRGLPPGPIRIPRPTTIDLVLAAETHPYIYMCAKEDFSGYHNFSASYREHQVNARKYQQALNARGIK